MCLITDYYKDAQRLLELCCHFINLVSVHAQNVLQNIQLQRVNQIGKLIEGMLIKKGREHCPSCWTRNDWLVGPIGTASAPLFSAHAHKVGHSSLSVSISAAHLCNNL